MHVPVDIAWCVYTYVLVWMQVHTWCLSFSLACTHWQQQQQQQQQHTHTHTRTHTHARTHAHTHTILIQMRHSAVLSSLSLLMCSLTTPDWFESALVEPDAILRGMWWFWCYPIYGWREIELLLRLWASVLLAIIAVTVYRISVIDSPGSIWYFRDNKLL